MGRDLLRRLAATALGVGLVGMLGMGCARERHAHGPSLGDPAPPYAAVSLDGDSVSLASLRGQVVLLNFWATWCAPCRHETPFLQALYEERRSRAWSWWEPPSTRGTPATRSGPSSRSTG